MPEHEMPPHEGNIADEAAAFRFNAVVLIDGPRMMPVDEIGGLGHTIVPSAPLGMDTLRAQTVSRRAWPEQDSITE